MFITSFRPHRRVDEHRDSGFGLAACGVDPTPE